VSYKRSTSFSSYCADVTTSSADDLSGEEGKTEPSVLQSSYEYAGTQAVTGAEVVTILTNLQRSMDKLAETNLLMLQLTAEKQGLGVAPPNSPADSVQGKDYKSEEISPIPARDQAGMTTMMAAFDATAPEVESSQVLKLL
jgi:hypothetical protein